MASPTKSLSSHHRMRSSAEFDSVFKTPSEKVHSTSFLVLAKHLSGTPGTLGLVVGKKNIPKAVARNRFKRIVGNLFGTLKHAILTTLCWRSDHQKRKPRKPSDARWMMRF